MALIWPVLPPCFGPPAPSVAYYQGFFFLLSWRIKCQEKHRHWTKTTTTSRNPKNYRQVDFHGFSKGEPTVTTYVALAIELINGLSFIPKLFDVAKTGFAARDMHAEIQLLSCKSRKSNVEFPFTCVVKLVQDNR